MSTSILTVTRATFDLREWTVMFMSDNCTEIVHLISPYSSNTITLLVNMFWLCTGTSLSCVQCWLYISPLR